jgi:hypothetical protein
MRANPEGVALLTPQTQPRVSKVAYSQVQPRDDISTTINESAPFTVLSTHLQLYTAYSPHYSNVFTSLLPAHRRNTDKAGFDWKRGRGVLCKQDQTQRWPLLPHRYHHARGELLSTLQAAAQALVRKRRRLDGPTSGALLGRGSWQGCIYIAFCPPMKSDKRWKRRSTTGSGCQGKHYKAVCCCTC